PRSTRSRTGASSVRTRRSAVSASGGVSNTSAIGRVIRHTPGRLAALSALAALAVTSCGGPRGDAATRSATKRPSLPGLCGDLRARVVGRVSDPAATELSGLVLSRSQRGVLWTHNDSGDSPRIFAFGLDGRLLAEVALAGAAAFDWEDIAAGHRTLWIGDIGDNLARRESVFVYRIAEPRVGGDAPATTTAHASAIELRYPDGPRDAEALLRDPVSGALVIVSKSATGRSGIYVASRPSPGGATTMRRRGRLRLGAGEEVTAGDVSADGRTIVLRTYTSAFAWTRRPGESVAAALRRRPCTVGARLLAEGQGESLALVADGRAFYTVPEGTRPALRRYAPG
ncbi:MAG: hypothetical protein QOJ46_965, partial [bacterium]